MYCELQTSERALNPPSIHNNPLCSRQQHANNVPPACVRTQHIHNTMRTRVRFVLLCVIEWASPGACNRQRSAYSRCRMIIIIAATALTTIKHILPYVSRGALCKMAVGIYVRVQRAIRSKIDFNAPPAADLRRKGSRLFFVFYNELTSILWHTHSRQCALGLYKLLLT